MSGHQSTEYSHFIKLANMDGPLSGFDHNQFDVTYSLGLSHRMPF